MNEQLRKCTRCKKLLPVSKFRKIIPQRTGVRAERGGLWLRPECKDCSNEISKECAKNNPEKRLLVVAKARAKKNNIPFNIEQSDIIIPEFCPLLGIRLENCAGKLKRGEKIPDSCPSLDRLVPNLGYTKGNVWVISLRANKLKNDASLEELEKIVSVLRDKLFL